MVNVYSSKVTYRKPCHNRQFFRKYPWPLCYKILPYFHSFIRIVSFKSFLELGLTSQLKLSGMSYPSRLGLLRQFPGP